MFSNIINGVITEKDKLFFSNESVLEYISQNELLEIITENTPSSALKEIQRILEPESANNSFYSIALESTPDNKENLVVQEIETEEAPKKDEELREVHRVPSQTSINKLISTQKDTEKYLTPSMTPNWKKDIDYAL